MYEAAEYNNEFGDSAAILMHINDRLLEQQRENNAAPQKGKPGTAGKAGARSSAMPSEPAGGVGVATKSEQARYNPLQILQKINQEK